MAVIASGEPVASHDLKRFALFIIVDSDRVDVAIVLGSDKIQDLLPFGQADEIVLDQCDGMLVQTPCSTRLGHGGVEDSVNGINGLS